MARKLISVCLGLVLLSACGGGGSSPTAPTPTIAQVAGLWRITARLTGVTGGECVGAALAGFINTTFESTLAVQQSGATLTGTSTDVASGATCQFTGTAGERTFTVNATVSTCQAGVVVGFNCGGGFFRDTNLITASSTGTVTGSTASGTSAEQHNVFVSGTNTGVGVMTLSSTFTAVRQ